MGLASKSCVLIIVVCCFVFQIYAQRNKGWLEVNIPDQGKVLGKDLALIRTKRIRAFYGIPFASPPINDLRFSPPMFDSLPTWKGVRNATKPQPVCQQNMVENDEETNEIYDLLRKPTNDDTEMSEDCLYLNIFSPILKSKSNTKLPVVIWLHPGTFQNGHPNQYNPYWLVYKKNVVVVAPAYRLNIFGFFTSLDIEAVGNFGLMDQIAAMIWTKTKISTFGGDPDNISLMGHDAGAISITLHLISPLTAFYNQQFNNNLFSKCVILSGNALSSNAIHLTKNIDQLRKMINDTADHFGCNRAPTSQLLTCLKNADSNALLEYSKTYQWLPVADQSYDNDSLPFLPSNPQVLYQTSDMIQVPLLLGFTGAEEAFEILSAQQPSQSFQEIVETVISNDLEEYNSSACDYSLVYDSVFLIYDKFPNQNDSLTDLQKELTKFSTDKTYGAPNFLLVSYILSRYPTVPIYMYRFDLRPLSSTVYKSTVPDWVTLPHLYDLIFIWGMPFWYPIDNSLINWDDRDKTTSGIMMMFFYNFFNHSVPTNNAADEYRIVWEPYSNVSGLILLIANQTFSMSDFQNFNYKIYDFWNNFYPKLVEGLSQYCLQINNLESSFVSSNAVQNYCFQLFLYIFAVIFSWI